MDEKVEILSLDYYVNKDITVTEINKKLIDLYSEIQKCRDCNLANLEINKWRPFIKIGKSPILVVSQNPSYYRDESCTHVWGGLDKLPSKFKEELKEQLNSVYVTNVVKCSTFKNEAPRPAHVKACQKWLLKEIQIIKPKKIVALGNFACKFFNVKFDEVGYWNNIPVFGLMHPQYVIRTGLTLVYVKKLKEVLK